MLEMREIAPDIFFLKVPVPLTVGDINVYIFRGDVPTLLDTGTNTPGVFDLIQTALNKLKIKKIEQVILTHWHVDHAGTAHLFAGQGAQILMNMKEYFRWKSFMEGETDDLFREWAREEAATSSISLIDDMCKAYGKLRQKMTVLPDHVEEIAPMQILQAGNYFLQSILTPGHTEGHLAFFENQGKRLFSGDMLLPDMISYPDIWREEGKFTSGLVSHLQSLDIMEKLDANAYFPSHGEPQLDPALRCQETRNEIHKQAVQYDPTRSVFENAVRLNHGTENLAGLFMRLHYVYGWKKIFEQNHKSLDG